ncbi:MAG: type II toxin-antitoxin system PemK/MazF family toxin [Thermodesulfobacteriota bacterium]
MVIRKGSIYWIDFSPAKGSEPMGRHPGLVLQNDLLNDSKQKPSRSKTRYPQPRLGLNPASAWA